MRRCRPISAARLQFSSKRAPDITLSDQKHFHIHTICNSKRIHKVFGGKRSNNAYGDEVAYVNLHDCQITDDIGGGVKGYPEGTDDRATQAFPTRFAVSRN